MKNPKFLLTVPAVAVLLFSGCSKDDTTPPKLTMNGDEVMTIYLNAPFNDPGVDANDNEDGDINVTSDVSASNPDVNKIGTYYIHYSVTDGAGNKSETRRTVLVKNAAEQFSGSYAVLDTCITNGTDTSVTNFTDGIITSTTINNRIIFTQFGRYTNANAKLTADIDFNSLSISIVSATIYCGTNPTNRTFTGGGAISFNHNTLTIKTYESTSTTLDTCTYIYVRQ